MPNVIGKLNIDGTLRGIVSDSGASLTGKLANATLRGYSAYDVAVQNGFEGTEEEWLESLIGNGIESVALNSDYSLTINFTDGTSVTTISIRGEKGEKGDKGDKGDTPIKGVDYWTSEDKNEILTELTPIVQADVDAAIAQYSDELDSAQANISTLQQGLSETKQDVAESQQDIAGLRRDVTTLQGNMTAAQNDITDIKSDISGINQDITDINDDISAIKTDVSDLQDADTAIRADISSLQNRATAVEGRVTTAEGEIDTLQNDLTDFKEEVRETLDNFVGIDYHICVDGEYNEDLVPTLEGVEGTIYLVPKEPKVVIPKAGDAVAGEAVLGGAEVIDEINLYHEWIYHNGKYERVGEKVAKDTDVEQMLKDIGVILDVALMDGAVFDAAVLG